MSEPVAGTWGRRLWAFLKREPLVHFALLGALLFGLSSVRQAADRETIRIDRSTVATVAEQQAQFLGRPLSPAEQAELVQGLIDDAVLLREAYRRGLEQDAVVERHLIQKMRFLLSDDLPEPGEAELRAHLAANRERYRNPPSLTLDHVFFDDPGAVPEGLLERLRAGADFRGQGMPLYMLGNTLSGYSARDLADLFGPANAQRIFELEPGVWAGPLRSAEGVHFVRVAARHAARLPAFEEVANSVREDWRLARQREIVAARVGELRQQYRIVVEPGEAPP